MAKHKVQVEKSVWSYVVPAGLALILGALAAGGILATRPVTERSSVDTEHPSEVVFIRGGSNASVRCEADAAAMLKGLPGKYSFSEGDINHLLRQYIKLSSVEDAMLLRVSDVPNVRITSDGIVYVCVRASVPKLSAERSFLYQVRGHIAPNGFRADMGWLGQCPIPLMNNLLIGFANQGLEVSKGAEALQSLPKQAAFSLEDGRLVVEIAPTQ